MTLDPNDFIKKSFCIFLDRLFGLNPKIFADCEAPDNREAECIV